ncbi:MAG: hypothetical protein U1E01_08845, partial [Methylicorpusculum sp.]|nr:hypothetical protein [Methylicorpusculum sp.]
MIARFFTNTARRIMVGPQQEFVFKAVAPESFEVPHVQKLGLYIHIPFCKTICPFCPYNKIRSDKQLTNPYLNAVLKEIELYHAQLG